MRAALYARFSSDHQKNTSITDQFRSCEQRAAREGWEIVERYDDRAISGTTDARPAYQRMLKDAKARQFDVLLVDDLSRLSRDTMEYEKAQRRLEFYGVRLIGVADGIDTSQEGHELVSGVRAIINQNFVRDLSKKIKRGMKGQAERGYWNGGRVYGYKLVPEFDPNRSDPYGNPEKVGTRLTINYEQAKWVKWIFEQYADGRSPLKIVTELNKLNVPSPGANTSRYYPNGPSWSACALHGEIERGTGLLHQNLYRGLAVWNRSYRRKDPDTGRSINVWRPRTEWIEQQMPHLRIIDDMLWQRVQERRRQVSQGVHALRTALGRRVRSTGPRPKYLFSSLLKCGVCGGCFIVCEGTKYGCNTFRSRGGGCTNTLKVERRLVEQLLLTPIAQDLFTEEGFEEFRKWAVKAEAEHLRLQKPAQKQAAKQLATVEQEIARLVQAIKDGAGYDSVKAELQKAEVERVRLLRLKDNSVEPLSTKLTNMVEGFKKMLGELASATQHQIDKSRGIIKDLVGEIVLQPTSDGSQRYLTAILSGNYEGLERVLLGDKIKLVAVTRIERVTRGL